MMRLMIATLMALGVIACATPPATGDEEGGTAGKVTGVTALDGTEGRIGQLMIAAGTEGRDSDAITVTKETTIEIRRDGRLVPATFDDLREGQRVRAWSTGAIMKSYPTQWTARRIIIEP